MENNELTLHEQKVVILSRLIKDSSLTLQEALLLLQEEEKEATPVTTPITNPGTWSTNPSWINSTPLKLHGRGITTTDTGMLHFTTTGSVGIGTTTPNTADAAL